jgi:8-oxo-dGTP pyrophosphatase MutT (NUDIX family)
MPGIATGMMEPTDATKRVLRVERCRLRAGSGPWRFAERSAAEIDRHWQRRSAQNPALFNGTIFILERFDVTDGALDGVLIPVEFKSFLYWKDMGYPDRSALDCFGSALIRSRDGMVLLGRQRAGNINAGLAYLPGGFIDPRDLGPDGEIDIAASILREAAEETGLETRDLARGRGFLLTFTGPMLSVAVELQSNLSAVALARQIRKRLSGDANAELEDVLLVGSREELSGLAMPICAQTLLESIFAQG